MSEEAEREKIINHLVVLHVGASKIQRIAGFGSLTMKKIDQEGLRLRASLSQLTLLELQIKFAEMQRDNEAFAKEVEADMKANPRLFNTR